MNKDINGLVDHIDDLSKRGIGDFHPTVLDIYWHGSRMGLSDSTIKDAIVLAALRARSIICCPLGAIEASATILPNALAKGADARDVHRSLGEPDARAGDSCWYYGLPFVGRSDADGDCRTYSERQQEWSPTASDPDVPPFAPLFEGERMFQAFHFIDQVLVRVWVTVLSERDLEKLAIP